MLFNLVHREPCTLILFIKLLSLYMHHSHVSPVSKKQAILIIISESAPELCLTIPFTHIH
jgi:hypothetical protein